jgi:ABC-2 type transport system permease protein
MRLLTVSGKTFTDLSDPKLLAAYFAPFVTVAGFFGIAMTDGAVEMSGAQAPLVRQEIELFSTFALISYFWVGLWLLALTCVLCANTFAKEAEQGTLQILLTKPVSRWQVLLGNFLAIVGFATFVGLASLLVWASVLFSMSGLSAAAIPGGIGAAFMSSATFLLFATAVVTAVGMLVAVVTKSRLRTALGTLLFPILYFAYFPIRIFSGEYYEDYALYLLDVNYHFGNAFVVVHELVGGELPVETQALLSLWSGVYETPAGGPNLDQQLPDTLELTGHVPPELSVALLSALALVSLSAAVYRFGRMDI